MWAPLISGMCYMVPWIQTQKQNRNNMRIEINLEGRARVGSAGTNSVTSGEELLAIELDEKRVRTDSTNL